MTGVQLLTILNRRRAHLSSLTMLIARYPQAMANAAVSREGRLYFYTDTKINETIECTRARLDAKGRVVVRPSDTGLLLHMAIEGEDHDEISALVHEIVDMVRERLTQRRIRLRAASWNDYELLDASDEERLERWGKIILIHPGPQTIWKTPRGRPIWKRAHTRYLRSNTSGGH